MQRPRRSTTPCLRTVTSSVTLSTSLPSLCRYLVTNRVFSGAALYSATACW